MNRSSGMMIRDTVRNGMIQVQSLFVQGWYHIRHYPYIQLLQDPFPMLLVYVVSGILLSITIPRKKFQIKKDEFYTSYGYVIEYQQAQRQYEEAQHNNNNNNDNNYNYYYEQQQSTTCKWYQFQCRSKQYQYMQYSQNNNGNNNNNNNNNNNGNQYNILPNWYQWLGGTIEMDDRQREEMGMAETTTDTTPGGIQFVYTYLIMFFVVLLFYGMYTLLTTSKNYIQRQQHIQQQKQQQQNLAGTTTSSTLITTGSSISTRSIQFVFFICIQFYVVLMILLVQGVLRTDERDLENSIYGWYGQMGILLVYTCFGMMIHCMIFLFCFMIRDFIINKSYEPMIQWYQQRRNIRNSSSTTNQVLKNQSSPYSSENDGHYEIHQDKQQNDNNMSNRIDQIIDKNKLLVGNTNNSNVSSNGVPILVGPPSSTIKKDSSGYMV